MRLALVFLALIACTASARVLRFEVLNSLTDRVVQQLNDGDVLSVSYDFYIVARVTDGARKVTFTKPWYSIDTREPFSIPNPNFFGTIPKIKLRPGRNTVAAYTDNDAANALSVTFTLRRVAPQRGPLPWVVVPENDREGGPIPAVPAWCNAKGPAKVGIEVVQSLGSFDNVDVPISYSWCSTKARIRVLEYSTGKTSGGRTVSKTSVLTNLRHLDRRTRPTVRKSCGDKRIFAEICGRRPGAARPTCATSLLSFTLPITPREPFVSAVPPPTLNVLPGRAATARYRVDPNAASGDFTLSVSVVGRDGTAIATSRQIKSNNIFVRLPFHGKGIPSSWNGASVFLNYARRSCPQEVERLKIHSSKLTVNYAGTAVLKQDRLLPIIGKLRYPRSKQGAMISLPLPANNAGGGKLKNGKPTRLAFQWFIRTTSLLSAPGNSFEIRSRPTLLVGENRPTLRIKAECVRRFGACGRYGCRDQKIYSVRVCNSLGCVFSNEVIPDIIPPDLKPDEEWIEGACEISKKS